MEEKNNSMDINSMEAISQKAMDEAEIAAKRAYYENPDPNVPDFDLSGLESASYIELPIWKKKLEAHLRNLDEVREALEHYPAYLKYIEAMKENGDENARLQAQQELEIFNALQNQGITMDMQVNSFFVKYNVNKKFLQDAIAKIDERTEKEYEEVARMTTSQKTDMMYKVLVKQYNEILAVEDSNTKNATHFMKGMLSVYMQRNTMDWINEALAMGHKPNGVVMLYRTMKKENKIDQYILEAFRIVELNYFNNIDDEQYTFFLFYLAYIANLSNKAKVPNIKLRIFKENITLMLQTIEDIKVNLYDLKDIEPEENSEGVETTWGVIEKDDQEGNEERYEETKKMAGIIYLNRLKGAIADIYGMAFGK